jgi:hypothetical protein
MSKPHIFIATPMYGGMCAGYYTQAMLTLQKQAQEADVTVTYSFMFNESLITRARNALVHTFLKSKATHLMFVDADIKFNPADIFPMLTADKDILCGIYPKKEVNWASVRSAIERGEPNENLQFNTGSFVVNLVGYENSVTIPVNEPVEIWNGGTGFMLIKREVLESLADKVPSYTNDVTDLGGTIKADTIKEYFATSIEEGTNRLLSEDYHFCMLWRKHGGQVFAAPWVQLGHVGTYVFDGKLLQSA